MSPSTHESRPLRLGLIGAGRWGRTVIRTVPMVGGVRLTRVVSRNPETAALAGGSCAVTPEWRDVAEADDVDGVIIAAPARRHVEMTLAVLASGRAVLVEKPLALDVAGAEAVLAAAVARRGRVLVDHIHLFSPAWRALKRAARALGPLRAIEAEAGRLGPFRDDAPVLWDWGPHDVAMCLDLAGTSPLAIAARRLERRRAGGGEGETITFRLGFAGGVEAAVTVGNLFADRRRLFVARFEKGTLVYDDTRPERLFRLRNGARVPIPITDTPPLIEVIAAFAGLIRARRADHGGLRLGVEVVRVLARLDAALAES